MKQLLFIEDNTENKISYYHLAAFLILLPFDFFYSQLVLISFGLHTVLNIRKHDLRKIFSTPVLVISVIYILGLVAILYSPDKTEAVNIATRQLAILLLPILFSITHLPLQKYQSNLLVIFGITCTLTILFLYAIAFETIWYFHLPVKALFTAPFINHAFSMPIELHATYMSLYAGFSLVIFLYLLVTKRYPSLKWIFIVSIVILSIGLLQLSSRAVVIAVLVILNTVFPFFLYSGKKRRQVFAFTILSSILLLFIINTIGAFKERYISELRTDLSQEVRIVDNAEPRLSRWEAILELVYKSPVVGYGSGSEKELLKEKYFEKKLFISYLNELNAHNEYLSFLIRTGITGLAIFLCVLYFGFANAISKKQLPLLCFMILFSIVCVSENLLDLNKGIFFYSFFFSLFLLSRRRENRQPAIALFRLQ